MKNKILLVNQSVNFLTVDIANAMLTKYDEVVLMSGSITNFERPLDSHVKVSKLIQYSRTAAWKRIMTWGISFIQIFFKILFCYRDYEILYFSNPPMSYFGATLFKNRFSVVVYDIYPDALRNVGIREGNFIYNYWVKKNRKTYARAEKVFTLSESMADALTKYVPKEKLVIIPNWSVTEKFKPIPKAKNPFGKEHGLDGKFIVMYSGNMGYTHSVNVLVDVAERMKDNKDVQFLLIGQGKQRPELEARAKEQNLTNCTFMDFLPVDVLPFSLASADIAMITLNEESAKVSVPGKTYDLLGVGAPLMCITPPDSEMARLIKQHKNGACFEATQVADMEAFITKLASHPELRKQMSDNSYQASKEYTKDNAYKYV